MMPLSGTVIAIYFKNRIFRDLEVPAHPEADISESALIKEPADGSGKGERKP